MSRFTVITSGDRGLRAYCWGRAEDKRRASGAGFSRHLVKPVDPQLLFDLIDRVTESCAAGSRHN
jgi:hypothetical protein